MKAISSIKPKIVLEGDLQERQFEDPDVLYFVQVTGLPVEQSRVSASGQQIFIPPEILAGSRHRKLLDRLTVEAQLRMVARSLPGECLPR